LKKLVRNLLVLLLCLLLLGGGFVVSAGEATEADGILTETEYTTSDAPKPIPETIKPLNGDPDPIKE